MTINSTSTTAKTTQTHNRTDDNSSIRTAVSLQELFDNNPRSVISQMAGNISRTTYDANSSLRAYGQSKKSEVTCRIIPEQAMPLFQETKKSIDARKKSLKLLVELQSKRLNNEMDKFSSTGDDIPYLKAKKSYLELQYIIVTLQKDI